MVCALLAEHNINILDITQTVLQEYFTMVMLVDTAACPPPWLTWPTFWPRPARSAACDANNYAPFAAAMDRATVSPPRCRA